MGLKMASAQWTSRVDDLHEQARTQTGLKDFGDTTYQDGLKALLLALDANPPIGPGKIATAESLIVAALAARLHTQAQWQANPSFKLREIVAPLIVIGVPRTGTTALHNLLSQDPQFQGIEIPIGCSAIRPLAIEGRRNRGVFALQRCIAAGWAER